MVMLLFNNILLVTMSALYCNIVVTMVMLLFNNILLVTMSSLYCNSVVISKDTTVFHMCMYFHNIYNYTTLQAIAYAII